MSENSSEQSKVEGKIRDRFMSRDTEQAFEGRLQESFGYYTKEELPNTLSFVFF